MYAAIIIVVLLLVLVLFKWSRTDKFKVEVKAIDTSNIPGRWIDIILPEPASVQIFTSKRKIKKKFHKPQTFQFKYKEDEEIEMVVISAGPFTYKVVKPANKSIIVPDESNMVKGTSDGTKRASIKLDLSAPEFKSSTVITYFKGKRMESKLDVPRVITLASFTERVVIKTENCQYVLKNLKPGIHKPKTCHRLVK